MDYFISYIYPPEVRKDVELTPLHLRLLCRKEIDRITKRVQSETGIRLKTNNVSDRSLLIGRHTDTGDYNPYLKSMRQTVNAFFEKNIRTDFRHLLIDYHPHSDMPEHNNFFKDFFQNWNALVRYMMFLCGQKDGSDLSEKNDVLRKLIGCMDNVFEIAGRIETTDPRADIIEPQLAYALRDLEMSMQKGQGYGHGLVGIFTVEKA
jgi:hypothetical protein